MLFRFVSCCSIVFVKVVVIVKPCAVSTCLWLEQKSTRCKC